VIGLCDTFGRSYAPMLFKAQFSGPIADGLGAASASIIIYLVMALILVIRPRGLFPAA
jgi:branched-chain amino acid transport system permease protein